MLTGSQSRGAFILLPCHNNPHSHSAEISRKYLPIYIYMIHHFDLTNRDVDAKQTHRIKEIAGSKHRSYFGSECNNLEVVNNLRQSAQESISQLLYLVC